MKKHDPWRLIAAAHAHAVDSGEPDHEVGDLQSIVEACFRVMFPDQKERVFEDWSVVELLNEWGPE
jgi:hypothetical protein